MTRAILARLIMTLVMVVVPLSVSHGAGSLADGQASYKRFCSGCHGRDGRGRVSSAPDFRKSEGLRKSNSALQRRIEDGRGLCPSFLGVLPEQKITNVIRYLRTFR